MQASEVLALTVSYDGAPYAGFARQPSQHTVQGNLEQALSLALRRSVETVCAGRTDAGVHALGQVVSFPLGEGELNGRNLDALRRSLNALTDDEVVVRALTVMPPGFSARFSAISREYRYFIVPGQVPLVFLRDYSWHIRRDLDIEAMRAGAVHLLGEHDFKSFCLAVSAEGKNTVRTVDAIAIDSVEVFGEQAICVKVIGNAFLHSMVRAIVGTLAAVGAGKKPASWVGEALAARNRSAAGENAPAKGLVFWRVAYKDGIPS